MNPILSEILSSHKVVDRSGNPREIHSHTSPEQCRFLDKLIRQVRPAHAVEIGLAFGVSALQIVESMSVVNDNFKYTVMDPFQEEWGDIGLLNLERAGYSRYVRFFREPSDLVLPRLHSQGEKIEFAYIDSTKIFDVLLVDVYFLSKMMQPGGVIVLDDCDFPGIRLLSRFLASHPSFKIHDALNPDQPSAGGSLVEAITGRLLRWMPLPYRKRLLLSPASDRELGVNYKCIAFRKVSDDSRDWDWFEKF